MFPRRRFLLLASAAFGAGCESDTAKTLRIAYQIGVSGFPDAPITHEQVAASPYAMIYAKMGRGPRSVLVLGQKQGDELSWISADRMALVTRGGRLVKTAGLASNVKGTAFLQPDPLAAGAAAIDGHGPVSRLVDFEDDLGYGAAIDATYHVEGPRVLTILGREHQTVLLREDNVVRTNGWKFQNYFWVDSATRFIWKSIQHTLRDYPPVDIEILKPAA